MFYIAVIVCSIHLWSELNESTRLDLSQDYIVLLPPVNAFFDSDRERRTGC